MDDSLIGGTTIDILDHKPPFFRIIRGIFYGANATTRTMVPVPVALGTKDHRHVDDLATELWMSRGEASVVSLYKGRLRISHFPSLEGCVLADDYTIFYENQAESVSPNRLLTRIADRTFWWGDVLVMRHEGKGEKVVDVTEEDAALVDLLVTWIWEVDELE